MPTHRAAFGRGGLAALLARRELLLGEKVLLLSLRVGKVGLNLQAASYVFHLDR